MSTIFLDLKYFKELSKKIFKKSSLILKGCSSINYNIKAIIHFVKSGFSINLKVGI